MAFSNYFSSKIPDNLKTFRNFEAIIAAICITIPGFLKLADMDYPGFRPSISDYVYMSRSYIFGMSLCVAAMLFIFNGAVFFQKQDNHKMAQQGQWYNVILGLSLLAVILLAHLEFTFFHYTFAIIFFVGNAIVIAVFHQRKYRIISFILAALTLITLGLHFVTTLSLFWGEWLSLTVIGIHFILTAEGIISINLGEPV
jgi:hypothetical protein